MFRRGTEIGAAIMALSLAVAVSPAGPADAAEAAGMKRTITMVAVEPKGGTSVDKEPFPNDPLPEGGGYILKAPNAEGRWEVSTYRWEPNQIIVNEGDEVTLEILGVNGDEHPSVIDGYDISFTVKRGQLTTVTFTADKTGVFPFRCGVHMPSMTGELIVLPSR
jgi:plastocyanin